MKNYETPVITITAINSNDHIMDASTNLAATAGTKQSNFESLTIDF